MVGLLFPRKHYRYLTIWQVFWLTLSTPSSHTTMAPYSDVADWVSTLELTAAGLHRTLTGFPLGVLFGRPNRLQKYKKKYFTQKYYPVIVFSSFPPSFLRARLWLYPRRRRRADAHAPRRRPQDAGHPEPHRPTLFPPRPQGTAVTALCNNKNNGGRLT